MLPDQSHCRWSRVQKEMNITAADKRETWPGGTTWGFKHGCVVCSGLSGCWFLSLKTQTISHKNTLRPMLIPEQAKSTWQPIKSRKQSSSFSVTLWDTLVSVCIDPILQMRHSRNSSTLPESSLICHWHWNQLRVCRQGNSLCGFCWCFMG